MPRRPGRPAERLSTGQRQDDDKPDYSNQEQSGEHRIDPPRQLMTAETNSRDPESLLVMQTAQAPTSAPKDRLSSTLITGGVRVSGWRLRYSLRHVSLHRLRADQTGYVTVFGAVEFVAVLALPGRLTVAYVAKQVHALHRRRTRLCCGPPPLALMR
jgi:hypothetical protein